VRSAKFCQRLLGGYLGTYPERKGAHREVLGMPPKGGSHWKAIPLLESHSATLARAEQSLGLASPNLSSQCCKAWLSALPTPALPESCQAPFLTASSVTSISTKSGVLRYFLREVMSGILAQGCLDSNTSLTESPVFSSMSSGSRIPPFFLLVRYLTVPRTSPHRIFQILACCLLVIPPCLEVK
jgi:hypothetical protein